MILIENPFELRVDKSFIIVSLGKDEDFLRVSTPYTPINNALILNYRIMCRNSHQIKPALQIIQDENEEGLSMVVAS